MKLALHRSISFWSGMVVMAFLGFTWWASMKAMASLNMGKLKVACWGGGVSLAHDPTARPAFSGRMAALNRNWARAFPAPFFLRGKEEGPPVSGVDASRAGSLREAVEMICASAPRSHWLLFIPHWMILPVAALPWLGLIAWRVRRRRRAELNPPLIHT